ncbi:MAG: site-specific integrase [Alphaproteobacteria bacterium]|nr:site-specific integrase [Alphaproteobacteria bacterium]
MSKSNKGAYLKWIEARNAWYIVWFEHGREYKKSTGTRNRIEADQALSLHNIEKDQPIDIVSPTRRIIADVLVSYAEEHAVHVASSTTIGFNIKALIPFWGHRTVADVRPVACREYLAYRHKNARRQGKTLSDATISRELGVLAAAIRHDYKQGRLAAPAPVWKPAQSAPKDRWLTREEVAHLLRTARNKRRADHKHESRTRTHSFSRWHLSFFILLALYTAARKEAILTLTWSQVDLQKGIIDLNKQGAKITNKRRAIVPIPRKLMTFLRIAKSRAPEICDDKCVMDYFGKPILRIDQSFRRVVADAGLKKVTPHTLRHTAATWMAQAGVPMWVISKYLGHTSTRTTERIYAHHNPDFLVEAKEALERGAGKQKEVIKNLSTPSPC